MYTKNSKTKQLLKYLAIGAGITILSMTSPTLPLQLLKAYVRVKRFQREKFLEDLKRLQNRELLDYQEKDDGSIKIILKKKGKKKVLEYKIEEFQIKKPKSWDGKWRFVMFDIPEKQKLARNTLSYKLKKMGFYRIQKSVFVYPYPCEDEIDFICSIYNVRHHVLLITVPAFEGAEKLKHYFQI